MNDIRKIKEEYDSFYKRLLSEGRLPLKDTGVGFWAISVTDDIIALFEKMDIKSYSHVLDLGSGDGKVPILAAAFTRAAGIEIDPELHNWALQIKHSLGSKAVFYNDDFMKADLKPYDLVFLNPDKHSHELERKLKKEFKGTLVVYGDEYLPFGIRKTDNFIAGTTPVHVYRL